MRDSHTPPTKECADWVEYALRHDGALFNVIPSNDFAWWQLANLDVLAFLIGSLWLVLYLLIKIAKWIFRLCCCGGSKALGKEKKQ